MCARAAQNSARCMGEVLATTLLCCAPWQDVAEEVWQLRGDGEVGAGGLLAGVGRGPGCRPSRDRGRAGTGKLRDRLEVRLEPIVTTVLASVLGP